MSRSAPTSPAVATSASVAPASSGFGNSTVGNSGSGHRWEGTVVTDPNPEDRSTSSRVDPPTPWSGVYAIRSVRRAARTAASPVPSSPATAATYPPRAPWSRPAFAARGMRHAGDGCAATAASISRSAGGTICEPPARYSL